MGDWPKDSSNSYGEGLATATAIAVMMMTCQTCALCFMGIAKCTHIMPVYVTLMIYYNKRMLAPILYNEFMSHGI